MSNDELLSWLIYYFSLFDVLKPVMTEVTDPLGLVQSQPIHNAERAMRVVFNASTSQDTLTARLARRYWGAGVQYISLVTQDIFATARSLRARRAALLEIPSNYYDDLETRFDVAPETIESMRELGIVYDRDEAGEYFQLFTRAFEKRFFFEIVERRGYDGYGAPNEPIRMAAQSRLRDDSGLEY